MKISTFTEFEPRTLEWRGNLFVFSIYFTIADCTLRVEGKVMVEHLTESEALIICGHLLDWSKSYPAPTKDMVAVMLRNIRDGLLETEKSGVLVRLGEHHD